MANVRRRRRSPAARCRATALGETACIARVRRLLPTGNSCDGSRSDLRANSRATGLAIVLSLAAAGPVGPESVGDMVAAEYAGAVLRCGFFEAFALAKLAT